jgi:hypothetical protein
LSDLVRLLLTGPVRLRLGGRSLSAPSASRTALTCAAVSLCLAAASVSAKPMSAACSNSTYTVAGSPLLGPATLPGSTARVPDVIGLSDRQIFIGSGCPLTEASISKTRNGSRVKARWTSCASVTGVLKLRATLDRHCTTMRGTIRARHTLRRSFVATSALHDVSFNNLAISGLPTPASLNGSFSHTANGLMGSVEVSFGNGSTATIVADGSTLKVDAGSSQVDLLLRDPEYLLVHGNLIGVADAFQALNDALHSAPEQWSPLQQAMVAYLALGQTDSWKATPYPQPPPGTVQSARAVQPSSVDAVVQAGAPCQPAAACKQGAMINGMLMSYYEIGVPCLAAGEVASGLCYGGLALLDLPPPLTSPVCLPTGASVATICELGPNAAVGNYLEQQMIAACLQRYTCPLGQICVGSVHGLMGRCQAPSGGGCEVNPFLCQSSTDKCIVGGTCNPASAEADANTGCVFDRVPCPGGMACDPATGSCGMEGCGLATGTCGTTPPTTGITTSTSTTTTTSTTISCVAGSWCSGPLDTTGVPGKYDYYRLDIVQTGTTLDATQTWTSDIDRGCQGPIHSSGTVSGCTFNLTFPYDQVGCAGVESRVSGDGFGGDSGAIEYSFCTTDGFCGSAYPYYISLSRCR